MVIGAIPAAAGGLYEGMKVLYRTGSDVNRFMDSHINEMKASETPTVARTGVVLEKAKFGFGVGYITPVVIVVTGQLLLGNPLKAGIAAVVWTIPNPVAMTCAAVGAIYWGWGALSRKEQEELLARLSEGLQVGIEFIRAVIKFVVAKTKELVGEKNFEALTNYVTAAREQTKLFLQSVIDSIGEQASGAVDAASDTFDATVESTAIYWKKLKAVILERDKPVKPAQ